MAETDLTTGWLPPRPRGAFGALRRQRSPLSAKASGTLPEHLRDNPAFRAAERHSRRVHFFKRAIPLGTLLVMIALVGKSFIGFIGGLDAGIDGISIQGSKVVMDKPRLSGFKRDGRSYELTATTATQDLKTPNVVDLNQLTARMQTGNDGWANLSGARGVYDSKAERLEVGGGLTVKTETGVDARLRDAMIEFKTGTIVTENPVEVRMSQGQVDSERMQVLDNGRVLVFEGRVRSTFVNATPVGAAKDARGAGSAARQERED